MSLLQRRLALDQRAQPQPFARLLHDRRGALPPDDDLLFVHARDEALAAADVACVIGTTLEIGAGAKLVQIHADATEIGRLRAPDAGIVGDCAAVLGILADGDVPLVRFSVYWWRTLHQPPTLLRPELSPPIAPLMLAALLTSLVAFVCGGVWYLQHRVLQLTPRSADEAAATAPEPRPVAQDVAAAAFAGSAGGEVTS